jgi:uncharacterized membrane protein YdjX (TVP38/TMEM64 family)
MEQPSHGRFVAFGVLLAAIVALTAYTVLADRPFGMDLSQQAIGDWVRSLGIWGGAAVIMLMIVHCFLPFPAEVVAFVAGDIFGLVWGTVYVWIGALLGALLSFGLSRRLGRGAVYALVGKAGRERLDSWSDVEGASTLLAVRMVPVIAFNLVNYAAGLSSVGWWTFTWTTGLGILPLTVLFVYLGTRMREATMGDWLLFGAAALALWFAYRLARRHILPRRESGGSSEGPTAT